MLSILLLLPSNILAAPPISSAAEIDYPPFSIVGDNGCGMDKSVQDNIFEPFFTTSSEGTGLGLYITKEVLESNRAKIRYIPPQAGGTCFRIYFQRAHNKTIITA